ncbi:hypothetical protein MLD38_028730 [Melastoma candidum]|uniref:Uncharacterized protein n=1 Tax=Melastoma candidum TaxID=119954 RepID=A0ACB9N7P3_9MYRT|nr:hypothetical protein MLD38_028730 [Melastoma candidum]
MASTSVSWCNACLAHCPKTQITKQPNSFLGINHNVMYNLWSGEGRKSSLNCRTMKVFRVLAVTKGSAESSKSEESLPSWARPHSDEPPPWVRDDGKEGNSASQSFELPYVVYLLASAVTAIAAIGSVFEYVNQRPVFGVLGSDSVFYAPLLGFFAISGIPTSAFLWFKSVQVANKEAEEQDRRDGYIFYPAVIMAIVGQEGKDQEGIDGDDPPQQLSLLQRIDRLDYLMQALEERHCCSLRHSSPSSRMVNEMEDGEGNHPRKTVTTVLEEVESKGTLLERVAVLEDRLMQLSLEMEASHASKSSSSVAPTEKVLPELESSQSDLAVAMLTKNPEEKAESLRSHGMVGDDGGERARSSRSSKRRRIRKEGRRWWIFNGRKSSCCSPSWDVVHLNHPHP